MKPRGRPKKYRVVKIDPKTVYFSPRGKPGRPEEADITVDEFEALRLADYLNKDQKTAAQAMRISQQTFSRILKKARFRMVDSLVNGKILRIQGGKYVVTSREDLPEKTFGKSE
ncbi:MAG: DUF134 domain-containing protein [Deltaproteobacteria bacterium]